MDTKFDDQFLVIEATIESNKQESNKNHKDTAEKITVITEHQKENTKTLKQILAEMKKYKNSISKSSPNQKDTLTPPDPTTKVQTNRRAPPLEEESQKILVACGPSNMRSYHQHSMRYSSRQNSKETLLWISRTYLTTSICLSMR